MQRGRPVKSQIRQNILEILAHLKKGYGYELHKAYKEIFPPTTIENIYYHLKKGIKLGEIEIEEVKLEKGEFSWGTTVQKTYYRLGPKAVVKGDESVKEYFEKRKKKS